jgi:ATP-binding cassette subfamily B multidrug efflux pump
MRPEENRQPLIEEMIGGAKVVKAFSYEQRASQQFHEINEKLKEYNRKATFYSSLTNPSTRFVNNLIYALVAVTGCLQIFTNGL